MAKKNNDEMTNKNNKKMDKKCRLSIISPKEIQD